MARSSSFPGLSLKNFEHRVYLLFAAFLLRLLFNPPLGSISVSVKPELTWAVQPAAEAQVEHGVLAEVPGSYRAYVNPGLTEAVREEASAVTSRAVLDEVARKSPHRATSRAFSDGARV